MVSIQKKKKIIIATGGTGGHIYPAYAIAQQLRSKSEDIEILVAGGNLTKNPYLPTGDFEFKSVGCGLNSKATIWNIWNKGLHTFKGLWESNRLIRKFKPDLVVGFGSYHTVPLLIAARLKKVPYILHESNYVPGKVTRSFSRTAKLTGVQFPATSSLINGKSLEVGVPLREGYTSVFNSPEEARISLGLDPKRLTLLIFGGSQGALTLNTEVSSAILDLAEKSKNFQLIHLTGNQSIAKELKTFYESIGVLAFVKDFEVKMDLAWSAADLAITRSGALTIAEAIAFEVPLILIPYPFATDAHQEKNALHMTDTVKGGKILYQGQNVAKNIVKTVMSWLEEDRKELKIIKNNISQFKVKQTNHDFSSVICEILKVKIR